MFRMWITTKAIHIPAARDYRIVVSKNSAPLAELRNLLILIVEKGARLVAEPLCQLAGQPWKLLQDHPVVYQGGLGVV